MSVCLSGLPGLPSFDAVGEPATLAQRWLTWKEEFELYVTASGISDSTQKRALLLRLAGPKVRDIFNRKKFEAMQRIIKKPWTLCLNILRCERMSRWLGKRL